VPISSSMNIKVPSERYVMAQHPRVPCRLLAKSKVHRGDEPASLTRLGTKPDRQASLSYSMGHCMPILPSLRPLFLPKWAEERTECHDFQHDSSTRSAMPRPRSPAADNGDIKIHFPPRPTFCDATPDVAYHISFDRIGCMCVPMKEQIRDDEP